MGKELANMDISFVVFQCLVFSCIYGHFCDSVLIQHGHVNPWNWEHKSGVIANLD